ncbi:MAG: flagellar basal body-associated FliL family protein [Clostridiales bacterium]|nr:flagellar basal body-associated FliL family protein [Clostridiales bacterium]
MEKKGNFFILLIIIAVLTLIIAVLAAFIVIVGINRPAAAQEGDPAGSYAAAPAVEPPDEASLSTASLLEAGKPINLKSSSTAKPSYAIIEMSVKYFNTIDGIKDVAAKIELNKPNLQEIVTTYFMEMSVEDFAQFETKARAKDELKQEFNEFLLTTIPAEKDRRKVKEIIYDVVFTAWNYQ